MQDVKQTSSSVHGRGGFGRWSGREVLGLGNSRRDHQEGLSSRRDSARFLALGGEAGAEQTSPRTQQLFCFFCRSQEP